MLLPSGLPGSLGRALGSGALFTPTGFQYDYAIGGLPFLSAATHQHPIVRETNPVQKNQFDMQNNPGEQTLAGWWMRSQQSFHGGAGQLYGDPASLNTFTSKNEFNQIRFFKSRGVDVWTQGNVSLLFDSKKARNTPLPGLIDATEFTYGDGTDAAFAVNGSTAFVITATTVTTPGTVPSSSCGSATTDGSYIFLAAKDGVYSAPIPATSGGTWTWTKIYTVSTTAGVHCAFVKSRIMLAVGPSLYGLASHPVSPPAALPTATYTHPDPSWIWTGITEGAPAIYVVGNNSIRGNIIKLVLDTTGALPTLVGGTVAAVFPSGEVPYSAMGYMGGFVGIGTNKGVRIAQVDTNADLTYGPILFTSTAPVWAWTARDRFLWCTVSRGNDGDSGLYRIDLSVEVDTLRHAYSTDLVFAGDTTDCLFVSHLGKSDLITYGTSTDTYVTDTTKLMAQGYLQSSRTRYNTLEPKLIKFLRVRGPVLTGPLSYQILDQFDALSGSHLFPQGQAPGTNDSTIDSLSGPQDFVSVKFVLSRDSVVPTNGGQMFGYQLKSLPGMRRQRIIQLPLLCYDSESDRNGRTMQVQGSAMRRIAALESIDVAGDVVVLQDFVTGMNTRCIIDRVSFQQTDPPPRPDEWGGVVTVTLRAV